MSCESVLPLGNPPDCKPPGGKWLGYNASRGEWLCACNSGWTGASCNVSSGQQQVMGCAAPPQCAAEGWSGTYKYINGTMMCVCATGWGGFDCSFAAAAVSPPLPPPLSSSSPLPPQPLPPPPLPPPPSPQPPLPPSPLPPSPPQTAINASLVPEVPRAGLTAYYSAQTWAGDVWIDVINNSDGICTGSGFSRVTAEVGNGASAGVSYVAGTTSSVVTFGAAGSVAGTNSVCSVSRYLAGAQGRILQSTSVNWWQGHWNGQAGDVMAERQLHI